MSTESHSAEHNDHILPLSVYFSVASALFVLTIVTVWVAQYDFGNMNTVVALGIAAFKASLVALFFMHLKYDNKLYASFFVGALVVLATFIIFVMFDTETRDRVYEEGSKPINQHAVIYDETGKPLNMTNHGDAAHGEDAGHEGDAAAGDGHESDGMAGDEGATDSHAEQPAASGGGGH